MKFLWRNFQCLSMSTSFCYGCLYAARKEVQGVGLTWGEMWQESSPGDSMSLGLVLLMIAFDGCLYAVIGYLVARYTNSGRNLPNYYRLPTETSTKHLELCRINLSTFGGGRRISSILSRFFFFILILFMYVFLIKIQRISVI